MKKIILLFLTIYINVNTFGQEYHKLIGNNKWNILLGGYFDCIFNCSDYENFRTHSLTIPIDSIVLDTVYKKLISTRFLSNDTSDFFVGLIREDTIEQKIFFRKPGGIERLIYDFSVSKGDTIKDFRYHDCGVCEKHAIVDSLDTIVDLNEIERQRFFIRDYYGLETWIEGIGSLNGLVDLQHIDETPNFEGLVCYWSAENLVFEKENNQFGCIYYTNITSLVEILSSCELVVFPNPACDIINISSKNLIKSIKLINLSGQKIFEIYPNSMNYVLDISEFKKGIFILITDSLRHKILIE